MQVAFFLQSSAGKIFCTGARGSGSGQPRSVLILPPFAEEMNKSRHVLAALVRALGRAGHEVLLPDLFGTGDSEGDFCEATLALWRADIDATIGQLATHDRIDLVGLRTGALLAADTAMRHRVRSLTLLHPQVEGRQQLTQMLRLRLAAGLTGGDDRETAAQLRQRLADGESLEIAGYRLSSQLARDLESLELKGLPPVEADRVHWLELVPEAGRALMPVSQRLIDSWSGAGIRVDTAVLVGEQFWATQEIARCPGLVDAVMQYFAD